MSADKSPPRKADRAPIGDRLRQQIEDVIAAYVKRMRNDAAIPMAKSFPRPLLEDHAMSFLGDLFQSLVVLEESQQLADGDESDLLTDSSKIQRLIADLHGRQRHRLGWPESALNREYEIFTEEVQAAVRRHARAAEGVGGLTWALEASCRLLEHARDASLRAYATAARESGA